MSYLQTDTIGGFNQFLKDQKEHVDEAILTLCTFSTDYTLVHDCVKLADVPNLCKKTYNPNGGTSLLDAMGETIESVGKKLAAMSDDDRPAKVIFLIITDGEDNTSEKFTIKQIKEMVQHQQDVYSWSFAFMGANLDAISAGTNLGISQQNSMNYTATKGGTRGLYQDISDSMSRYRTSGSTADGFFGKGVK
jgi:uncharacterized protein YegL